MRSSDLEQKIHSVKLPYLAWKVLFLLGEKQSIESLADLLGESQPDVDRAVALLAEQGLIKEIEEEKPVTTGVEEQAEEVQKEEEQIEEEQEKAEAVVEEETPVSETAEQKSEEELAEAPETEEEEESALEEDEEIKGIGDFELPELEEESDLEEEPSELESQISEMGEAENEIELPQIEEETAEKLDVDFEKLEEQVEQVEEEKKPEEEKAERMGAPGILVIDDSIVIRKMVELALESEDFILEAATSGKEGLKKLDEIKPDLVILDLMLPDINGIDLLKTIKASLGIPVIMLSGKDSPQMIEKAKAEGADAFLPKPFRDEDLVKTIHELLEK